jgi:molybdopterin synthase sulfur carrier subunit
MAEFLSSWTAAREHERDCVHLQNGLLTGKSIMHHPQLTGTALRVLAFGRIAEIMHQAEWETAGAEDLLGLEAALIAAFPALRGQRFVFAVNRKVVSGNVRIEPGSEIALLPPFSGG